MRYSYEFKTNCIAMYPNGNCYDNFIKEILFGRIKNEISLGELERGLM